MTTKILLAIAFCFALPLLYAYLGFCSGLYTLLYNATAFDRSFQ